MSGCAKCRQGGNAKRIAKKYFAEKWNDLCCEIGQGGAEGEMQQQYFSVTIISSPARKLGARGDFEGFEGLVHLEVPTNWSRSVIHIFKNKQIKNPNKYKIQKSNVFEG